MGYTSIYQGTTPPPNPTVDSLWLSTSMADMRISSDARDRPAILSPAIATQQGVTFGGSDANYQEPNCYYEPVSGNYVMIFTSSNAGTPAVYCAYSKNPISQPWTPGGLVVAASEHTGVYIENGIGYLTATPNAGSSIVLYTFSFAAGTGIPTGLSGATTLLTLAANLAGVSGPFGNSQIFKRAVGDYVLLFEASWGGNNFQCGTAVATSAAGPYTVLTMPIETAPYFNPYPVPAAYPVGYGGNMFIVQEGSKYINFSMWVNTVDTYTSTMWRGVTTDYTLSNWTWDQVPLIRRGYTPYDTDQVADPCVCFGPSGAAFLFWDGVNNVTGGSPSAPGVIFCSAFQPVLKQWDGTGWQVIAGAPDYAVPEFYNYTAVVVASQPLNNLDDRPGNAAAGTFTMTLPRATVGARVRVSNVSTSGTNAITIAVNGVGSDTIPLTGGTSLAVGAVRTFRCYKFGIWNWS